MAKQKNCQKDWVQTECVSAITSSACGRFGRFKDRSQGLRWEGKPSQTLPDNPLKTLVKMLLLYVFWIVRSANFCRCGRRHVSNVAKIVMDVP